MSAILFNDIIGFILRQLLGHYQLPRDTVSLYTQIRCQISGYRTFCPLMVLSCPFIWSPYFLSFHGPFLSFHGPFLYIHLVTVLSVLSWSFPVHSSGYSTFMSFPDPFLSFHLATVLSVFSWSFPVHSSSYRTFCPFMVLSCPFIQLPYCLSFHFLCLSMLCPFIQLPYLLSFHCHFLSMLYPFILIPYVLSLSLPCRVISMSYPVDGYAL